MKRPKDLIFIEAAVRLFWFAAWQALPVVIVILLIAYACGVLAR